MSMNISLTPAPAYKDPISGSVTEYSVYTIVFDAPLDAAMSARIQRALDRWPVGWEYTAWGFRSHGPIRNDEVEDVRAALCGALPEPPPVPPPVELDDKDREWRDRRFR